MEEIAGLLYDFFQDLGSTTNTRPTSIAFLVEVLNETPPTAAAQRVLDEKTREIVELKRNNADIKTAFAAAKISHEAAKANHQAELIKQQTAAQTAATEASNLRKTLHVHGINRTGELQIANAQVKQAVAEAQRLTKRNKELEALQAESSKGKVQVETELKSYNDNVLALTRELAAVKAERSQYKDEAERQGAEVTSGREAIKSLRTKINDYQQRITDSEAKKDSLNEDMDAVTKEYRAEYDQLLQEITEYQYRVREADEIALRSKEDAEASIAEIKGTLASVEEEVAQKKSQIAELEAQIDRLKAETVEAGENARLKNELITVQNQLDACRIRDTVASTPPPTSTSADNGTGVATDTVDWTTYFTRILSVRSLDEITNITVNYPLPATFMALDDRKKLELFFSNWPSTLSPYLNNLGPDETGANTLFKAVQGLMNMTQPVWSDNFAKVVEKSAIAKTLLTAPK